MSRQLWRKFMFAAVSVLLFAAIGAELGLRALGYADLPLYRADPLLGYAPLPGASGTFAGDRRWAFNARGMRMDGACQPGAGSMLLLGDSIVHGGTTVSQEQTLGARLAALIARELR